MTSSKQQSQPLRMVWDRLEALEAKLRLLDSLEEVGFPAFLETLAEAAVQPVPPTHSNWLVQRAMLDGQLATVRVVQEFFDQEQVRARLAIFKEARPSKFVGQKNPFKETQDLPDDYLP